MSDPVDGTERAEGGGGEGRGTRVGEGALHAVEDFGLGDAFGEECVDAVAEFVREPVDVVGAPGGGESGVVHGAGPVRGAFPQLKRARRHRVRGPWSAPESARGAGRLFDSARPA